MMILLNQRQKKNKTIYNKFNFMDYNKEFEKYAVKNQENIQKQKCFA